MTNCTCTVTECSIMTITAAANQKFLLMQTQRMTVPVAAHAAQALIKKLSILLKTAHRHQILL